MGATSRALQFTSDIAAIERVREFIRQATEGAAIEPSLLYHLQLVVVEAVTNVIEHAYRGAPDQPIWLEIDRDGPDLAITLRDRGAPFDLEGHPDPDVRRLFDEGHDGGLGVYLMRRLTRGLALTRENGQNILRMRMPLGTDT